MLYIALLNFGHVFSFTNVGHRYRRKDIRAKRTQTNLKYFSDFSISLDSRHVSFNNSLILEFLFSFDFYRDHKSIFHFDHTTTHTVLRH